MEYGFFSKHRDNQARRLVPLHRDIEAETGCDQSATRRSRPGGYEARVSTGIQSAAHLTAPPPPADAGLPER